MHMSKSEPSSKVTRAALTGLSSALEAFRSHREDPPLFLLAVFLAVAQRKAVSATQISKDVRLSQSATSRNIIALGRGKAGEPGLGLVVQEIDPHNPRAHVIKLTAKGRALAEQLAACAGVPVEPRGAAGCDPAPTVLEVWPQEAHWSIWMD